MWSVYWSDRKNRPHIRPGHMNNPRVDKMTHHHRKIGVHHFWKFSLGAWTILPRSYMPGELRHLKWPIFKRLNDREVLKMILYRWKHRGGSSLNKFPALHTVHFAIFDDVKSPYYALETIFTVYPTGNGPIFGKLLVKIGLRKLIKFYILFSNLFLIGLCSKYFNVRSNADCPLTRQLCLGS